MSHVTGSGKKRKSQLTLNRSRDENNPSCQVRWQRALFALQRKLLAYLIYRVEAYSLSPCLLTERLQRTIVFSRTDRVRGHWIIYWCIAKLTKQQPLTLAVKFSSAHKIMSTWTTIATSRILQAWSPLEGWRNTRDRWIWAIPKVHGVLIGRVKVQNIFAEPITDWAIKSVAMLDCTVASLVH